MAGPDAERQVPAPCRRQIVIAGWARPSADGAREPPVTASATSTSRRLWSRAYLRNAEKASSLHLARLGVEQVASKGVGHTPGDLGL